MKLIKIFYLFLLLGIFLGCSAQKSQSSITINKVYDNKNSIAFQEEITSTKTFVVNGEGVAPSRANSKAQSMVLAKRAAIADAYRQLAEMLYGAKINAQDRVNNAILQNSRITSEVYGIVKNATIVENVYNNGIYIVRMEMKIDENKWEKLFNY